MKPFEQATTEELRARWESQQPTQTEIVPAEPLTEPLEVGQLYYYPLGQTVSVSRWDNGGIDHYRLKEKMIFPDTKEGKAGAALRAKVPHPGLHWQEDLKKLNEWWKSVSVVSGGLNGFHIVHFLDKYLTE